MARSLNKVMLIGNLTRDPELRYTAQGTAVCNFGLATNRYWTTDAGEKKEDAEFHRVVSWNKLAELCSQLLAKGRKVYVEGRLQTRTWTGADGNQRTTTETVISNMVILDSRRAFEATRATEAAVGREIDVSVKKQPAVEEKKEEKIEEKTEKKQEVEIEEKAGEEEGAGVSAGKTDDQSKKKSDQGNDKSEVKKKEKEEKVSPDEIPF